MTSRMQNGSDTAGDLLARPFDDSLFLLMAALAARKIAIVRDHRSPLARSPFARARLNGGKMKSRKRERVVER